MAVFLPTLILQHKKENQKKCSLRLLRERKDFFFLTYPYDHLPSLSSYILLTLEAPVLSSKDKEKGLLLIDGTWRLTSLMIRHLPFCFTLEKRSLPHHYRTAYPRRQKDCSSATRGLASVEALFLAYLITQREDPFSLLNNYHWKNEFLEKNNLKNISFSNKIEKIF